MAENGIVHRDIKPKIGDHGLAKSVAEAYPSFCVAGTNGYMAPEVLLKNTDHHTLVDVWSLGCVMLELLTGKVPFEGEDDAGQLYKVFDVLGVPGKKAWMTLKPRVLTDEVQRWRARQQRLGHRNQLRKLVPLELLSRDGFDVLKGLLVCDPKKRLTAAAALQFPWFAENVDNALVRSTVVSETGITITKSLSLVWQMAKSFAGRTIRLLEAKAL